MSFWEQFREAMGGRPANVSNVSKFIGYWCIPIGAGNFTKLPIKEKYATSDWTPFYTARNGHLDLGWAIIGNARLLAEYIPWVKQTMSEIESTSDPNLFRAATDPTKKNDFEAERYRILDYVTERAIGKGWAFVIDSSDGQNLLIGGNVPPISRALLNELTGKYLQEPRHIRVPTFSTGIVTSSDGQILSEPIPLEELLLIKAYWNV